MYKIKKIISKLLGLFGYEIQKHSSASFSVKEPFYHFRNLIDDSQPLIFDVGAYVGDTIEQFKLSFPESYIQGKII